MCVTVACGLVPLLWLAAAGTGEARGCEPFCQSPCSELNGQLDEECGGCTGPQHMCRPGQPGFGGSGGGAKPEPPPVLAEGRFAVDRLPAEAKCPVLSGGQASVASPPRRRMRLVIGFSMLRFDCACPEEPGLRCGMATDLRARRSYAVYRSGLGEAPWLYRAPDGRCLLFDRSVAAHMQTLCALPESADELICLEKDATARGETCVALGGALRTMRKAPPGSWARDFPPVAHVPGDAPDTLSVESGTNGPVRVKEDAVVVGAADDLRESDGCLSFQDFLRNHAYSRVPVLMRGCAADTAKAGVWRNEARIVELGGDWCGSDHHCARNSRVADITACAGDQRTSDACTVYLARLGMPRALREHLFMPPPFRCAQALALVAELWLWYRFVPLDGPPTEGNWHYDEGHYMVIQIDGSKEFTLVDDVSLALDGQLDPERPNSKNRTAKLKPGDVLFIPRRTRHSVRSFPGRNIAVTLDLDLPPPEGAQGLDPAYFSWPVDAETHDHAGNAATEAVRALELFSSWRTGRVPLALRNIGQCGDGRDRLLRANLGDVPALDDAEMIWKVVFQAGLGWDF